MDSGASALAPLLDGSTAGEPVPELVRLGLQQLIELEVAAVHGALRHQRSEEHAGYRNDYRPRQLTTKSWRHRSPDPETTQRKLPAPSILEPRRRLD